MTLRGRAPLAVAVVVLVVLAVVLVQRGDDGGSPFGPAGPAARPLAIAQAATTDATSTVVLADLCAPGGAEVTVRAVVPYGVTGGLRVVDVAGGTTTVPCDVGDPQPLVATVARGPGESAHADGFDVTVETGGEVDRVRLRTPVTLCRQLSEC